MRMSGCIVWTREPRGPFTVTIEPELVVVKGPKGELSERVSRDITVAQDGEVLVVTRPTDRGGYRYHGRVKAFAEGVREGGLTV